MSARCTYKGELTVSLPRLCQSHGSLTSYVTNCPEMGVTSATGTSIVVDTTQGQKVVATAVVRLNSEAQEIKERIETILLDRFGIDVKKYNITVRLAKEDTLLQVPLANCLIACLTTV